MPLQADVRFEEFRPYQIAGLTQVHRKDELATSIPKQWVRYKTEFPEAREARVTYGVVAKMYEKELEYLCGIEVSGPNQASDGASRIVIDPRRYVVFTHEGNIKKIGQSWDEIFDQRLPKLELAQVASACFERYDHRYDPIKGEGVVEIWVPYQ